MNLMNRIKAELSKAIYYESICLRKVLPNDYVKIIEISVYDGKFARNELEAIGVGEKIENDCAEGNSIHWAICDAEDGNILGTIGFYRGFSNSTGEIGYVIKQEFRMNGYCTKAIKCVCEFGFSNLQLNQIVAYIESGNVGSKRALENNGFRVASAAENRIKYFLSK